jgi:hypothetical protein
MGGRAEMIKPGDGRAVIDGRVKLQPQKKLIDAAKAALRIAANEIDIQRFEIGRRIGFAGDDV